MRILIVSLLAGFLLVVPGGGVAHAKTCPAPAYPSANGRYTSDIKARHLGCADAYKLLTKQYACRVKNGPEGRCVKLVMHFACREDRYSDFYSSDVRLRRQQCSNNRKKVSSVAHEPESRPLAPRRVWAPAIAATSLRVVGLDAGAEPRDHGAVGVDEELLEVPGRRRRPRPSRSGCSTSAR